MGYSRAGRPSNLWTRSLTLRTLALTAWLGVWTEGTAAQGSGPEVVTLRVGETAALTAPVPVPADAVLFVWYRGTETLQLQRILTYLVSTSTQNDGPQSTGRESAGHDGTLQITDLRTSDTGNYTVVVTLSDGTPTTGRKQLRVSGTDPPPGGPPGLSGGAIAGIVIGVLAGITAVCVLVYIFVIKKPASELPLQGNSTDAGTNSKAASANPKANGAAEDVQYSSVNFMPKGSTPLKPISTENTVYSEVRR